MIFPFVVSICYALSVNPRRLIYRNVKGSLCPLGPSSFNFSSPWMPTRRRLRNCLSKGLIADPSCLPHWEEPSRQVAAQGGCRALQLVLLLQSVAWVAVHRCPVFARFS